MTSERIESKADGEGFDALSVSDCDSSNLPQSQIPSEAESEAVWIDPGLKAIADAWPKLAEAVKQSILAIVQADE